MSTSTNHTVTYTQPVTTLSGSYSAGNNAVAGYITGAATPGATLTITESTPHSIKTYSGTAAATSDLFTIMVDLIKGNPSPAFYSYSVAAQAPGYLEDTTVPVNCPTPIEHLLDGVGRS